MTRNIHEGSNHFYIGDNANQPIAEITFTYRDANTIDVNHTFVDPSLRGEGIAKQLFDKVIEKAQNENLKIIPTCSYVYKQFEKNPELASLKAK
ncbi:GNAT family N-acetyltransferase [Staphylococcus felis]|uniref:N-acetyltransferase n=1 Tax=Staphylococcus felis TaxID=46127 RepID=A0A3E0IT62_9STAP|nr:GNAT family N-acetyltransferase [Staphylococcus felis]REH85356.1 N-acetyltransferase [Staphylococcus felis]REH90680.1 N-acetyltransferase [Staphylococcus felis]REI01628.1 N-acetyltransferase [Staphylococcus felis]